MGSYCIKNIDLVKKDLVKIGPIGKKIENILYLIEENQDIKCKIKQILIDDNRKIKKKIEDNFIKIREKLKKGEQKCYNGKKIKTDIIGIKYYIKKYYYEKNNIRCLSDLEYKDFMKKIEILEKESKRILEFEITEGYVNTGNQYLLKVVYENLRLIYKTYDLYGHLFPEVII